MKKQRSKQNNFLYTIIGIFAFIEPFWFFLYRDFHYFLDDAIFSGFCYLIYGLMIAFAVFDLAYIYIKSAGKPIPKIMKIIFIITSVISVAFFALNVGFSVGVSTAKQMFRSNFLAEVKYIIPCALALIFLFAQVKEKKRLPTVIISVAVLTVSLGLMAFNFLNLSGFEFLSNPVVFDTGSNYSVVFSTNSNSVGYIEYNYNGKTEKLYDEESGRIVSNTNIHNISVPYEKLKNNNYTVTAVRVDSNVAYTPKLSKTIVFSTKFGGEFSEKINVTAITDNHNCRLSYFDKIAEENSDALFVMGDFADMVSDDKTIIDNLLYPASKISKGEVPVIYVKGNHDDRGEASTDIADILGLDSFYYQTYLGYYRLTILDSGECNVDNFVEYGGLANFTDYRQKELSWLSSIKEEKGKYDLVLCHDPLFSFEESVAKEYNESLKHIGTDLCISGHLHELFYNEDGYKTTKYPIVVCGGVDESIFKDDLRYTVFSFDKNKVEITGKSVVNGVQFNDNATLQISK